MGPPRRTTGWLFAVAVQPPLRHGVDDGTPFTAQLRQACRRHVHELPERAGEVSTVVALEAAPFVLLGVEVGTVAG